MSPKNRFVSLVYVGILLVISVVEMSKANYPKSEICTMINQTMFIQRILQPPLKMTIIKTECVNLFKLGIFNLTILEETPKVQSNCSTPANLTHSEAERGEFPHQALLGYPKLNNASEIEFRCGGSLISNRYVLTAAHCWNPKIVRLGEYSLDDDSDGQQDFEVDKFIRHPNYTSRLSYHDIALVRLTQEVQFTDTIRPALLWRKSTFNMKTVVATGFGRTSNYNDLMPSKLMKVGPQILDKEKCWHKYKYDMQFQNGIIPEQLCIGSDGDSKDTCEGDSGGPVQVALDFETCDYYVVGVISLGNPSCGVGNSEAVYTQVESYLDWIDEWLVKSLRKRKKYKLHQ